MESQGQTFTTPFDLKTQTTKNVYQQYLKEGSLQQVVYYTRVFDMDPNEDLSVNGGGWTGLHFAVLQRNPQLLEFLLRVAYRKHQAHYSEIVNLQNSDG